MSTFACHTTPVYSDPNYSSKYSIKVASMSEDNSSVDVTEKAQALEKEYNAFRGAIKRSRNIRILIMLGAVALVVVISYMFYTLVSEVMTDKYQKNLLDIAQKRIEKNKDDYMREVKKLVEHSSPILKDAFYKQTKKDMPKYTAAFAKEREAFADNITKTLKESANEHYAKALKSYQDKMIADIPELKDPAMKQKAMDAVGQAFDRLVEKYYVQKLADGMEEIYFMWDEFPEAEESKNDKAEDVLIGLLLELVSKKMAN